MYIQLWKLPLDLVRCDAPTSGNWKLEQSMFRGRAGRQRKSRPPPPPPALTSHPKDSGKGKSMGSRSAGAQGPGLESDPCRVFTDLKADRFKWAHLYLERKLWSPDPDKATFYSMKIYCHHPPPLPRHLPPRNTHYITWHIYPSNPTSEAQFWKTNEWGIVSL